MNFQTRAYFDEHEQSDVEYFTIAEYVESADQYRIIESWDSDKLGQTILQYHIPKFKLEQRVEEEKCSIEGFVSEDQLAALKSKVSQPATNNETATV